MRLYYVYLHVNKSTTRILFSDYLSNETILLLHTNIQYVQDK